MKVKASIKKRSVDCKIVRRKGVLFVINKKNPRFKQSVRDKLGYQLTVNNANVKLTPTNNN